MSEDDFPTPEPSGRVSFRSRRLSTEIGSPSSIRPQSDQSLNNAAPQKTSYKLTRKLHISNAQPTSREFLVAAATEVGMILHRYIAVHDKAFSFSIRKIIPIPGLFRPIDFRSHYKTLRFIETDLELVLEQLPESGSNAHDLCVTLYGKADGTEEYSQRDYKKNVLQYQLSIQNYRSEGSRLNRLLNNS